MSASNDESKPSSAETTVASEETGDSDLPQGDERVHLDPARFTATITHPYWPMAPGTRWVYRETDQEGTVQKVVVVATHRTKMIANGVQARVVRDTVSEDGEIVEDTYDWYAQDDDGNLWYLGENTAEFEHGKLTTKGGSFEAGVDGAQAGIVLPGDAQPGTEYRQEYYKGEAEDNGAVLSKEEMAEVRFGLFRDVLLTRDTNTLEPDAEELKMYAKGVGPILILAVSGGTGREELLRVDKSVSRSAGTGPLGHPRS